MISVYLFLSANILLHTFIAFCIQIFHFSALVFFCFGGKTDFCFFGFFRGFSRGFFGMIFFLSGPGMTTRGHRVVFLGQLFFGSTSSNGKKFSSSSHGTITFLSANPPCRSRLCLNSRLDPFTSPCTMIIFESF